MTDFMEWLYDCYIKPEIDRADIGDYKKYFTLLSTELTTAQRDACEWAEEFYAINGFLLGLRTGVGLYSAQPRQPF